MVNPYEPTAFASDPPAPDIPAPTDERHSVRRFAVVAVYGLCNLSLLITVLSYTLTIAALFVILAAAAPATLWAYLDADIRGYRIRLWEILLLAIVWPIGLPPADTPKARNTSLDTAPAFHHRHFRRHGHFVCRTAASVVVRHRNHRWLSLSGAKLTEDEKQAKDTVIGSSR